MTRPLRQPLAALATVLCGALVLAACGAKHDALQPRAADAKSVSLMLDWVPNPDHVGIYAAQADGAFRRAGLNVQIHVPSDPASPLQLLESGKVDVAVSYEPELMLARDKGATLVGIAAMIQRPLTSIISVGSEHITSPAQLRGKTVGTSGIPYERAYLNTILQRAHVPQSSVKVVNVGDNLVPAMLSHRVDATIGGYWNVEALQLQRAGKKPNVIHMENVGVPDYDELVLVTTQSFFADHTAELRLFVQALARGYQAVRADPQAGVNALVTANPAINATFAQASVKATLASFFPAGNEPWGWQNQQQWNAFGNWMLARRLLAHPQVVPNASTNQLLAGQGP